MIRSRSLMGVLQFDATIEEAWADSGLGRGKRQVTMPRRADDAVEGRAEEHH
jgi:hypothetical protein